MYRNKNKIIICITAAILAVSAVGCGSSDKEKKGTEPKKTEPAVTTAAAVESPAESVEETGSASVSATASAEDYKAGELLTRTAALFEGAYTYEMEITFSDEPEIVTYRTQASDGSSVYVGFRREGGETLTSDTAYISTADGAVSADMNIKAYSATEDAGEMSIVRSVIENQLERTYTHIPQDTEGMTVEEYTYTGETFITVYDFYFDEEGTLKKYTASYNIEGEEQLIETAVVKKLSAEYEGGYFDEDFLADFTDFDAMTEDERLGFCQEICGKYGISTDDMYSMGITTDDLKRIDFDKFGELVYKFAPAADEKSDKDKKDSKADKDKKDKDDSSAESEEKKDSESQEDTSKE